MEKVRCPNCGQWANWKENKFRPFCSENCKQHDLGNWASERYRVSEPVYELDVTQDSHDSKTEE